MKANNDQMLIYQSEDGSIKIDVRFEDLDIHNDIHSFSFAPTTGNVNDTDWRKCTFTFTSPVGNKLRMKFINLEGSEGSNDFAIDDILVTQAYEACTTTLTTTVTAQITRGGYEVDWLWYWG